MYDLGTAVGEWIWKTAGAEEEAEEKASRVGWKYKRLETQKEAKEGDIVTVALNGPTKKFTRVTQIRLGAGLFDKDLEHALIGKRAGKGSFAHSLGTIDYEIEKIERMIVPAVTDDMVKAENIAGVHTLQELVSYYYRETLRTEFTKESYTFTEKYFLPRCEFVIAAEDIAGMTEHEMDRCRGISKSMGKVFDEMTQEELMGAVGFPDIPSFKQMLHVYYNKVLRTALLGTALKGENEESLTQDNVFDYYKYFLDETTELALQNSEKARNLK
jgi:hypothetical protein